MDSFAKITPGQRKLLDELATLRPFERIEIVADKEGKIDTFFVHRSSKVIITGFAIIPVK